MLSSLNRVFADASHFVPATDRELDRVAGCVERVKVEVERVQHESRSKFDELARQIGDFLSASEAALSSIEQGSIDEGVLASALAHMKLVGVRSEELRTLVSGKAMHALSKTMRALIDGPYLLLARGHYDADQGRRSRESVEASVRALAAVLSIPVDAARAEPE